MNQPNYLTADMSIGRHVPAALTAYQVVARLVAFGLPLDGSATDRRERLEAHEAELIRRQREPQ